MLVPNICPFYVVLITPFNRKVILGSKARKKRRGKEKEEAGFYGSVGNI